MKAILIRIWRLTMLAATGPGAWKRAGLYGFVLSLEFLEIWFGVQMIKWSKAFYDALEQLDAQAALRQVALFFVIVAAISVTVLVTEWYKKSLRIDLRQHLTERAVKAWLHSGAYWLSRPGLSPQPIENPDQRIAEDCKQFVDQIMMFTIDIISKIVGLVTYLTMLWTLADFPLSLAFIGIDAEIPRYMVWTAFIYVALSSWLTHRLGYPLKSLNFRQEMREADFRHALVQVRDGADQIAQSGGELAEQRRLSERFEAVKANWFKLIRRDFVLGMFTVPYYRTVLRIPTFLAAPAYFGGAVTLGGMMQLSSTFSSVTTSLSWFIFNYSRLADFVAVTERLEGLFDTAAAPLPSPDAPRAIQREASSGGRISAEGLRLFTPQGRALDPVPDFTLDPGERVWISGASGQGKTTFLSALKGLWQWGEGRIDLPPELVALPQLAAPFGEGILPALTYPEDPALHDRKALEIAMVKVGLGHRIPAEGTDGPAALQGLSMGERQRLALARVLVQRPKWLLLDEPTSALDPESETELLALIRAELPGTTILCVAHRPPQGLHPWRRLHLGGRLDSLDGVHAA